MKILVYTDVHGNREALDNLMKSKDYKTADLRVFLGDAVNMCPYSEYCVEKLAESGDILLKGNHDVYCAYGVPKDDKPYFNNDKMKHLESVRKDLSQKSIRALKEWKKDYRFEHDGHSFYFTHYPWESDMVVVDDPDEPAAPTRKTAEMFSFAKEEYVLFGHNHKLSITKLGKQTFICVGSLGGLYPGHYVVIEIEEGHVSLLQKTIQFNLEKLKSEMINQNYPFAKNYITWFEE